MMWRTELRRLPYKKRVAGTPLIDCWHHDSDTAACDWRETSFIVCDAEMSSLDPATGELLSLGWVIIRDAGIALSYSEHHLCKARASVGQSAEFHQIRDCDLSNAETDAQILERFLSACAGRTLVLHHDNADMAFLNALCKREYNAPLLLSYIDTMERERSKLQRRNIPIKDGDLRLHACRKRYNLPAYAQHNALVDAMATAELLLAQIQHASAGHKLTLGDLLHH